MQKLFKLSKSNYCFLESLWVLRLVIQSAYQSTRSPPTDKKVIKKFPPAAGKTAHPHESYHNRILAKPVSVTTYSESFISSFYCIGSHLQMIVRRQCCMYMNQYIIYVLLNLVNRVLGRVVEEINCNVKIAWDLFYLKNIMVIDDDRCNTPITTLVGRILALNLRINRITV